MRQLYKVLDCKWGNMSTGPGVLEGRAEGRFQVNYVEVAVDELVDLITRCELTTLVK